MKHYQIYDRIIKGMEEKKKHSKGIKILLGIIYIIGVLVLVVSLKNLAKQGNLPYAVAYTFYDIYVISVGVIIFAMMPFRISYAFKKIAITSFLLTVAFLIAGPCLKYIAVGQEILADMFYLFAGAMFYQGVGCTVRAIKLNKTSEVEDQ